MKSNQIKKLIPNYLSFFRLVVSFFIPYLIVNNTFSSIVIAKFLFIVGAITDYLDGKLARKHGNITKIGKIIDPIADKFLVLGALFSFSYLGLFPIWIVIIIAIREVLVTVFRFWKLNDGNVIAAKKSGKVKTVSQIMLIFLCFIIVLVRKILIIPDTIFLVLMFAMFILLGIVVFTTIYSGLKFIKKNN